MFVFVIRGSDYAYILGMYLGDGCINRTARTWQMVNPRNISVSHRDSVAIMERIVGPKF